MAARRAGAAVVVVGLPPAYESEGADRTHLDLPPAHNALVEAVLAVQPRLAVVLLNGSAVALPWAARVPAIVEAWLGGQGGGGAIAEVLLGQVNPSGKLAETFPARLEDTPAFLSFPHDGTDRVPFAEGIFTGYRWFDTRRIEPLFPFGHGLSYTSFTYADLALSSAKIRDIEALTVSLRVRNTGARAGQEVVQLYLHERRPRLPRPEKELRGFAKVALEPGEEAPLSFRLGPRDFAVYDPRAAAWTIAGGVFDLPIGASSRDIRLQESVAVDASRPLPMRLDRVSPLRDWLRHPVGRERLLPIVAEMRRRLFGTPVDVPMGDESTDLAMSFLTDTPLRKLVVFGALSEGEVDQLVAAASGIEQAPAR